jgi:hypothetical protein
LGEAIAMRIRESADLQSLFRDGDWWMSVRKMTSSAENRARLLDDLTRDVNLAAAFKERPELARAWERVKHLPDDIRLSVVSLQNISDILSSTLGRNDKLVLIKSKISSSNYEHGIILAPDGTILELRVGSPNGCGLN